MTNNRVLGWTLFVIGTLLIVIALIWGRAGFYADQAVMLILLALGGGTLTFFGGRMLRKPRQDVEPVDWRSHSKDE